MCSWEHSRNSCSINAALNCRLQVVSRKLYIPLCTLLFLKGDWEAGTTQHTNHSHFHFNCRCALHLCDHSLSGPTITHFSNTPQGLVSSTTVNFRMVVQMANSKSQMVNGKGYDFIVWRQSVIVPTGTVVIQDWGEVSSCLSGENEVPKNNSVSLGFDVPS